MNLTLFYFIFLSFFFSIFPFSIYFILVFIFTLNLGKECNIMSCVTEA